MFIDLSDIEYFKLWRKIHDRILRNRHGIAEQFSLDKTQPASPVVTFEWLCQRVGMTAEFEDLLVKLRTKAILPSDLAMRAEQAHINKIVRKDQLRRSKAAAYQARRRASKAAEFKAQLESVQPVQIK